MSSDGLNLEDQIHVILDTNALWGDFGLKAADFGELVVCQNKGLLRVYVPEVVVHELSRQAQQSRKTRLFEHIKSISKGQLGLQELDMPDAPNHDIADLRKKARAMTHSLDEMIVDLEKRLQDRGVQVLPLPSVDVRSIFERYVSRRKPFKEDSGEGMADDLLWRTVVEHAESAGTATGTRVIFVTNNSSDFGKEKNLHKDLKGDLSGRCEVELWSETKSFLSDYHSHFEAVVPEPEPTDLMSDYYIIRKAVSNYAESELGYQDVCGSDLDYEMQSGLPIEGYDLPPEAQNPYIKYAEVDESSVVWDSYFNERGTELGRVEVSMDVAIQGYVFKSEFYDLIDSGKAAVVDADWNDHMAVAEWERRVRMVLHIRLESEHVEVLNLESLEIV